MNHEVGQRGCLGEFVTWRRFVGGIVRHARAHLAAFAVDDDLEEEFVIPNRRRPVFQLDSETLHAALGELSFDESRCMLWRTEIQRFRAWTLPPTINPDCGFF